MREFRIIGNEAKVDQATKRTIGTLYPPEDEIKLLRRAIVALANGEPLPDEFIAYNDFVERIVAKRRRLKGEIDETESG
jgi:hypothetical protein